MEWFYIKIQISGFSLKIRRGNNSEPSFSCDNTSRWEAAAAFSRPQSSLPKLWSLDQQLEHPQGARQRRRTLGLIPPQTYPIRILVLCLRIKVWEALKWLLPVVAQPDSLVYLNGLVWGHMISCSRWSSLLHKVLPQSHPLDPHHEALR